MSTWEVASVQRCLMRQAWGGILADRHITDWKGSNGTFGLTLASIFRTIAEDVGGIAGDDLNGPGLTLSPATQPWTSSSPAPP